MPKLIKNGGLVENPWVIVEKNAEPASLAGLEERDLILPLNLWLEHGTGLASSGRSIAVWLDSDETPEALAEHLESLPLIALNFPAFMDGRAYTSATTLRQRYDYTGEIRAIGDVLRDQLFFMKRCGFDAFDLADSVDVDEALAAFGDFTTSYMSTVQEPLPLFRRRS